MSGLATIAFVLVVIRVFEVNFLDIPSRRSGKAFVKTGTSRFAQQIAEYPIFRKFLLFAFNNHFQVFTFHHVTLLGCAVHMFVLAPHLHQVVKFGLDFFFVDCGLRNGHARVGIALDVDFRVNFHFYRHGNGGFLVVVELCNLQLAYGDDVRLLEFGVQDSIHGLVHDLMTDGIAELLQNHGLGNLALAETLQRHLLFVLGQLLFERSLQVLLGDIDFEGTQGCAGFFDFNGHIDSGIR